MAQASSAEVARNFSAYRELADGSNGEPEAVHVLHYNKPSVVIVSAEEFTRLKRRDKQVMATEELPERMVNQIKAGQMDPRFSVLDEAE
jgi:hypothetical protein